METDFDSHKKVDVLRRHLNTPRNIERPMKDKSLILPSIGAPEQIIEIPLSQLLVNPFQPRKNMDPVRLAELADSIETLGLMQPVVVFNNADGAGYTIVLGHRRVEAHKLLGRKSVRAIVTPEQDKEKLIAMVLVENIQREDLNTIELAIAFRGYLDAGYFKNAEAMSRSIGKSASVVSRYLNILTLPDYIIEEIREHNTMTDLVVIDLLRKQREEIVPKLYEWYKSVNPTREEFAARVKSMSTTGEGGLASYKYTKTKTTVMLPSLNEQQRAELEKFINALVQQKGQN